MSIRVLVVDDHDVFRRTLRAVLTEEGFEVADAPNGDAALRCVSRFRPHVVVMDVNMPGMSGIEATRRALRVAPETVVVMLSLFGDEDLVLMAGQVGASGFLLKDARLEEIVSAIRSGLRRKRDAARSGERSSPPVER